MMPAQLLERGMERMTPPTMVAIMLNIAAATVALQRLQLEGRTRSVTLAMDATLWHSGMKEEYRL